MVRKRKKKESLSPEEESKKQHRMNMANAAVIIRHSLESVVSTGVDRSLIRIFETVRHWPSLINNADPSAFVPPFDATGISAEETVEDGDTVTLVTFSYSGKEYVLVSKVNLDASTKQATGNITLDENGEWVINMDIVRSPGHDHYAFQDLNSFRHGAWMENVLGMAVEIESHEA